MVPVAHVSLRVQTEVRRREQELLEDIRLRGAVADGANRRGRPQVGRNLDEIAKARDAHTVAHADGDARRGLGVLGHVAVLRSSSAGDDGDATIGRRRAANARSDARGAEAETEVRDGCEGHGFVFTRVGR